MPSPEETLPQDILTAEYGYLANTAFQANEDRARVASFYLVSFGSFLLALFSVQWDVAALPLLQWGFVGLFLALAVMALLTILQLARLRMAWFASIEAMNAIKEYYIARHPSLQEAILWRNLSAPAKLKPNSVGFLQVLEVSFLGGASLGAACFYAILVLGGEMQLIPPILAGGLFAAFAVEVYRAALRR